MTTVLLARHGRTAANATGVLAGWTPGVTLDAHGVEQAKFLSSRLEGLTLNAAFTSPLDRCVETAKFALEATGLGATPDDRIGECRYGDWTGQALKTLAKEPMWKVVQAHPSAAVFPGPEGEALRDVQARAVNAIREWNGSLGDAAVYIVFSHGDVIKAILADALGLHLDQFQRIVVDPCSVSVVQYTDTRPFVVRTNDTEGALAVFQPPKAKGKKRTKSSDATVGGGAGGHH